MNIMTDISFEATFRLHVYVQYNIDRHIFTQIDFKNLTRGRIPFTPRASLPSSTKYRGSGPGESNQNAPFTCVGLPFTFRRIFASMYPPLRLSNFVLFVRQSYV